MPTDFPPRLLVRTVPGKGRGVFTASAIGAGRTIRRDPVVEIGFDDVDPKSALDAYPMRWTENNNALAFGLISFVNHSDDPNCDAIPDVGRLEMALVALRGIAFGEELTIRYACPLWFKDAG